jgi:hypothetical protein
MPLSSLEVKRLAGLELSALLSAGNLPADVFDNARIKSAGTEIYDVNGELIFYRVPINRGRERVAFADVAANESLGGPLLAISAGIDWNESDILEQATTAARKARRNIKFDKTRFVAYSFPKVAVQFLLKGQEVLMLEWVTWREVPEVSLERSNLAAGSFERLTRIGNFERWSLLDELPRSVKKTRARRLARRLGGWSAASLKRVNPSIIGVLPPSIVINLVSTWELHYSKLATDHFDCYELRGQQTNVWCVAASTEMLMNFYRYDYTQVRLAQELGLGTLANPNGLPYANVGQVVTVIENLSSNSLASTMYTNPGWGVFASELNANRPVISFIPGHSRTIAGYTQTRISLMGTLPFSGLLVYDPWPPNAGVITRWENFATQTYLYAYSAVLQEV